MFVVRSRLLAKQAQWRSNSPVGACDGFARDPLPDLSRGRGPKETMSAYSPFTCPNEPPCEHSGLLHDIWTLEEPLPTCCVEGCKCGRAAAEEARKRRRERAHHDANCALVAGESMPSAGVPATLECTCWYGPAQDPKMHIFAPSPDPTQCRPPCGRPLHEHVLVSEFDTEPQP
jgi:hypothetical protein